MENAIETKEVKQEVKPAPATEVKADPPKKVDGRARTSASNLVIGRNKVRAMMEERALKKAEEILQKNKKPLKEVIEVLDSSDSDDSSDSSDGSDDEIVIKSKKSKSKGKSKSNYKLKAKLKALEEKLGAIEMEKKMKQMIKEQKLKEKEVEKPVEPPKKSIIMPSNTAVKRLLNF